jgi:hypothetical protein
LAQDLNDEQNAMVNTINQQKQALQRREHRNRAWNKYVGYNTNSLLIKHLNSHLVEGFKAVGPSVFIQNTPTEFDTLVIETNQVNLAESQMLPRNSVRLAIEVKDRGLFDKKSEVPNILRQKLAIINEDLQRIPYFYITFHESPRLIESTREVFGKERAFFLSTGSNANLTIISGEWERFVNSINAILR